MNKKTVSIIVFFGITILFLLLFGKNLPVELGSSGSLPEFSLDDLISKSELIITGEVLTTLPSQWKETDSNSENASPAEVARARGLFTDSLVSIDQILKGKTPQQVVRVRSFTGETARVIWSNPSQPSYNVGKTYLLFLVKDFGATATINPGDYIAVGAFQGVYEIINDRAVSMNDERNLEELIAYIQNALSEGESLP